MRALLLLGLISALGGCASVGELDRSLVASPLLAFEESELDRLAPHTGLRGSAAAGGGACSTCAH